MHRNDEPCHAISTQEGLLKSKSLTSDVPYFVFPDRLKMDMKSKGPKEYILTLEMSNVAPQDAGSYRVMAKNALGESNATIGLNFDGKKFCDACSV